MRMTFEEGQKTRQSRFLAPSAILPIPTNCDLTDTDEVHFQECLVDIGDGKFYVRLNVRAEFNATT